MVIDTSALVAILHDESEKLQFLEAIAADQVRLLSAGTYLEAKIVVDRQVDPPGGDLLEGLISRFQIQVVPHDAELAQLGAAAYGRYGKGVHPAGLNFGDCFAYALAKQRGEPLLFKGDDFSRTDVATVLRP